MSRRAGVAALVVLCWLGGLALLARRELFRGPTERLIRAAMLIAPGAEYFAVSQEGRHIGFASTTIDTTGGGGVQMSDFFTADVASGGRTRRASIRVAVRLTRGLRLRSFAYELGPAIGTLKALGVVTEDSALTVIVSSGRARPDTQHYDLHGPLYVPSVVPIAILLGEDPEIGSTHAFTVFDPVALRPTPVSIRVAAESLFVVPDSSALDSAAGRFVTAHLDTLRGWRLEEGGGGSGMLTGWYDAKGRLIRTREVGTFVLQRTAYEMAFRNWQIDMQRRKDSASHLPRE